MRISNYVENKNPENWLDLITKTRRKKYHKYFQFAYGELHSESLIFIDFHQNPLILLVLAWLYEVIHSKEHVRCVFGNFRSEIFLMRRSNYIENTNPENWLDPITKTYRKKYHKYFHFATSQTMEIIVIQWRRHFVAWIPPNPSTKPSKMLGISETSLCSRVRSFP